VIRLTARLTLRASYLPLPPFCSSPFSHSLSLITALVTQHMAYRGVSTQLPLIKIIGILILQLTLFILLLSSLLLSRTFFCNTPCRKNAPSFFCQSSIQNLFCRFFLYYNFHSSLMNMPIIYIQEIETTLLTLFGRILGFIQGKGR
jgi:hypothetical protein